MACLILSCLEGLEEKEQGRHRRTLVGVYHEKNLLTPHTDNLKQQVNRLELPKNGADEIHETFSRDGNRKCVKKVMMTEETVFDEVMTCDHSYDKRCITSYITRYEPYQEEECGEQFRKSCFIKYEKKSVKQVVEVCRTPLVKDCDIEGEEICKTMYESECWTKYHVHEVEDDVPRCQTIIEEKCQEVSVGYTTEQKCDKWPREVCSVEKRKVEKTSPQTGCDKIPKLMCTPVGCGVREGPVECREVPKTIVVDNPVEDCEMDPVRTCKFVTKLVPKLTAKETCMDVPKEICSKSRGNPRRVKKPLIKTWCFKPEKKSQSGVVLEPEDGDCTQCVEGISGVCDIQHTPYTQCKYCLKDVCVTGCQTDLNCPQSYQCYNGECRSGPGKVLISSITINTAQCKDCGKEGVRVSLSGEVIGEFLDGVPCSTNTLDHTGLDFTAGGSARFDGLAEGEDNEVEKSKMGACFKAPLNAQVRGGRLTWLGSGTWTPESVCVDWLSTNMAFLCEVENLNETVWSLVRCRDLTPKQKCD